MPAQLLHTCKGYTNSSTQLHDTYTPPRSTYAPACPPTPMKTHAEPSHLHANPHAVQQHGDHIRPWPEKLCRQQRHERQQRRQRGGCRAVAAVFEERIQARKDHLAGADSAPAARVDLHVPGGVNMSVSKNVNKSVNTGVNRQEQDMDMSANLNMYMDMNVNT